MNPSEQAQSTPPSEFDSPQKLKDVTGFVFSDHGVNDAEMFRRIQKICELMNLQSPEEQPSFFELQLARRDGHWNVVVRAANRAEYQIVIATHPLGQEPAE